MSIIVKDRRLACDLHTHSNRSDGTFTPSEVVRKAEELQLYAVALCDHNTVKGIPEFLEAASKTQVKAVSGVEISADFQGNEVHVLGLFIKNFDVLEKFLTAINTEKHKANLRLCACLNEAGIRFDYSEVENESDDGVINRVHFARVLVKHGYVKSVNDAFQGVLNEKNGYYKPQKRVSAEAVIKTLVAAGAIPVIAHPLENLDNEQLEGFIKLMKPIGLKGMETNYTLYDDKKTVTAIEIAEKYGLLKSGGSDFHGDNKPGINMGTGKGKLFVPKEYYLALKQEEINL